MISIPNQSVINQSNTYASKPYACTMVPTEFFFYNDKLKCLIPVDSSLIKFHSVTGLVDPPQGYTAIYTTAPTAPYVPTSAAPTCDTIFRSPSISSCSSNEDTQESNVMWPKPKQRKYPHRSKQIRILEVYNEIKTQFTKLGCYAKSEKDTTLRGDDVLRIHVKTFSGLNQIQHVLQEVYNKVSIKKLATPIAMKNSFQKKGFIVYLQVEKKSQVPIVQEIFKKYTKFFKKCEIAERASSKNTEVKTIVKDLPIAKKSKLFTSIVTKVEGRTVTVKSGTIPSTINRRGVTCEA